MLFQFTAETRRWKSILPREGISGYAELRSRKMQRHKQLRAFNEAVYVGG
jgi:hypothetical protein